MDDQRYVITDKVVCSACAKKLWKQKDWHYPAVEPELVHNTLVVELSGGDGMFFDTDFTTHPDYYKLYLCHDCAHKLVGASPFLTRLLKGGHFHGWTMEDDIHNELNECVTDFHNDWGKL